MNGRPAFAGRGASRERRGREDELGQRPGSVNSPCPASGAESRLRFVKSALPLRVEREAGERDRCELERLRLPQVGRADSGSWRRRVGVRQRRLRGRLDEVAAVPLEQADGRVELDRVLRAGVASPVAELLSVSTKISKNMSGVSAGRLVMLIWKVISPASSLETTMLVMSGASTSSPVESGKVVVFEPARDESPEAMGTAARATPRTSRSSKRRFTETDFTASASCPAARGLSACPADPAASRNAEDAEPRLVLGGRQRHVGLLSRRPLLVGRRAAAVLVLAWVVVGFRVIAVSRVVGTAVDSEDDPGVGGDGRGAPRACSGSSTDGEEHRRPTAAAAGGRRFCGGHPFVRRGRSAGFRDGSDRRRRRSLGPEPSARSSSWS